MLTIDPSAGWRAVDERLARTENPRHRHLLEVVVGHLQAEMNQDLEGLMDSLVEDPIYHTWGSGRDTGPKGYEAVRAYYSALVQERRGVLEYTIERIVVDDDVVVTEGDIRAYQPGAVARAFGFDVDRLDITYLVTYRALLLWPFDAEGRLIGEDGYGVWDIHDAVPVPADQLPEAYVRLFDPAEHAQVGISVS